MIPSFICKTLDDGILWADIFVYVCVCLPTCSVLRPTFKSIYQGRKELYTPKSAKNCFHSPAGWIKIIGKTCSPILYFIISVAFHKGIPSKCVVVNQILNNEFVFAMREVFELNGEELLIAYMLGKLFYVLVFSPPL